MGKYWYRVDLNEGNASRTLVGTSEFDIGEFVKRLTGQEYLLLTDLSYRDNQNRIQSWSEWDPRLDSVAYINPKAVTRVMPFVGDPRRNGPEAP